MEKTEQTSGPRRLIDELREALRDPDVVAELAQLLRPVILRILDEMTEEAEREIGT